MAKTELKNDTTEIRQMRDWNAIRACLKARERERSGDFEGARAALSGVWTGIGKEPNIENLEADTRAEVLLRVGTLSGWIGSGQQIAGAQELAKDLISRSLRLFERLNQSDKVAETQTDLAICYWREGAFDEARVLYSEALSRCQSAENNLRILINSSILEDSCGRYDEALNIIRSADPSSVESSEDHTKGRYFMQLGFAYKKLGQLDEALIEYSAASFYLSQVGHMRYVARINNNIALILMQMERFAEAMIHLDRARATFLSLKDTGNVAQVNETRARVYIAQRHYHEAERVASAAVAILEQGDEQSLLAEALITQATALARSARMESAKTAFRHAAEVAATAGDSHSSGNACLIMIEELAGALDLSELVKAFLKADGLLGVNLESETAQRLRRCARLIARMTISLKAAGSLESILIGGSFETEVLHFEAQLIRQALDQSDGSITHAAKRLGLTHQGLAWALKTRHKNLQRARKPPRRRCKPIIKQQ